MRKGVVDPDRAMGARDFVPEIHATAKRPADLELPDRARFEVDQRHCVVVVGDRMDERVGVAHDLDRPVALANEPADDLDAVAPEVDDRATTGQPAVPEPRGVRSRVRLARADPGDVSDRSARDGSHCLERLRCVAEVLEVATEDSGALYRLEDSPRLVGVAAEWLRDEDRLARGDGRLDRLDVQVVRHPDHHDIGLRVRDGRDHVGRVLGDVPALTECAPALLGPRVHHTNAIAAALGMEGSGV